MGLMPLDELYLEWLYSQVGSVKLKNPTRTYWHLARKLYSTEFFWLIPNDDNRMQDGLDLRLEFMAVMGYDEVDPDWMNLGCSFLEMLIALSRCLSFEADGLPREWFWQLIDNLGLFDRNDRNWNQAVEKDVADILETVNFRIYKPNGEGGLFPLRHPQRDQRDVEIWYQLNAYLTERDEAMQ